MKRKVKPTDSIKKYIDEEVTRQLEARRKQWNTWMRIGSPINFRIDYIPMDDNLLKGLGHDLTYKLPKDPGEVTFSAITFNSYNSAKIIDEKTDYKITSIKCDARKWTRKKDKPRFSYKERRALR